MTLNSPMNMKHETYNNFAQGRIKPISQEEAIFARIAVPKIKLGSPLMACMMHISKYKDEKTFLKGISLRGSAAPSRSSGGGEGP